LPIYVAADYVAADYQFCHTIPKTVNNTSVRYTVHCHKALSWSFNLQE